MKMNVDGDVSDKGIEQNIEKMKYVEEKITT